MTVINMKWDQSVESYMGYASTGDEGPVYARIWQVRVGKTTPWNLRLAKMPIVRDPHRSDLALVTITQPGDDGTIYQVGEFTSPSLAMINLNDFLAKKGLEAIMSENGQSTTRSNQAVEKLNKTLTESRRVPRRIPESREIDITIPVNSSPILEDAIETLEEDKSAWEDQINMLQAMIDDADNTIRSMQDMITEMSR